MPVDRHRHPELEQKIGRIIVAAATSTGISSPLSAKGQIWVYGTSDQALDAGTDGYVLKADSSAARGVRWAPADSLASPLNTKGDLFAYAAGNARLPVGTSGQILTPRSTSAIGLAWVNSTVIVSVSTLLRGELLMQDGVTSPPVPIETEAGDDWLYQDV